MKIISVVGARPNFMKIAPFIDAICRFNLSRQLTVDSRQSAVGGQRSAVSSQRSVEVEHILVHTGQHYDRKMSDNFFEELNIPEPDINLGVGSGSHAEQVGQTMIALEKVLIEHKPDWVVVVGDVNATLASSVTAKKLLIKVAHIEAGLRSGDMSMPEEINRLVTDRLSDLLFTPDRMADENLRKEGVDEKRIRFVGNIMIDTLENQRKKAEILDINKIAKDNLIAGNIDGITLIEEKFAVLTLHRPSNVDHKPILSALVDFLLNEVTKDLSLVWTIHPRTEKQLKLFGLWESLQHRANLILLNPLGYHEMLNLNMNAKMILTDSGGLQEECTVLGTPCLTLRWNTERPITLKEYGGASVLVGNNIERIRGEFKSALLTGRDPKRPELWDGHAAERILKDLMEY
jgi:UDP-N-acetylglucosamine 2-epimerase (non-hydrolysing)